jgi:RNA:NAD 2''-phosphotransferase
MTINNLLKKYPDLKIKVPLVLYHFTNPENVDSILKKGLLPELGGTNTSQDHLKGRVYLTSDYKSFIRDTWDEEIYSLLQVKLSINEIKNLEIDPEYFPDPSEIDEYLEDGLDITPTEFYTNKLIKSSQIKFIKTGAPKEFSLINKDSIKIFTRLTGNLNGLDKNFAITFPQKIRHHDGIRIILRNKLDLIAQFRNVYYNKFNWELEYRNSIPEPNFNDWRIPKIEILYKTLGVSANEFIDRTIARKGCPSYYAGGGPEMGFDKPWEFKVFLSEIEKEVLKQGGSFEFISYVEDYVR